MYLRRRKEAEIIKQNMMEIIIVNICITVLFPFASSSTYLLILSLHTWNLICFINMMKQLKMVDVSILEHIQVAIPVGLLLSIIILGLPLDTAYIISMIVLILNIGLIFWYNLLYVRFLKGLFALREIDKIFIRDFILYSVNSVYLITLVLSTVYWINLLANISYIIIIGSFIVLRYIHMKENPKREEK